MKVDTINIQHNGWHLKMNLLVPLDQEVVDQIVHNTLVEMADKRLQYQRYEEQLRQEYASRTLVW